MDFKYSQLSEIMSSNGDTYYNLKATVYYDTGNYGLIYAKTAENNSAELEKLLNKHNQLLITPIKISDFYLFAVQNGLK